MGRHFVLAAGEESGDLLGASLMRGLRSIDCEARFSGVGGQAMSQVGLKSLFTQSDLAVMGIAEVIPRLPTLLSRIRTTADHVIASDADALITIDSPDFSLRVARLVRKVRPKLRIIHYVSPSIWAWRPKRARKMQGIVDLVLTLLPFEPRHLEDAGIRATFVGHPTAEMPTPRRHEELDVRRRLGIPESTPILLVLPGSRDSEVRRLAPVFGATAKQFVDRYPEHIIVVPAAESVRTRVQIETQKWNHEVCLYSPVGANSLEAIRQKAALFATADLALAASGTVTLELAAARTPMVVGYDVNWLSRFIISALLNIPTVTIINIIVGKSSVPELLGKRCRKDLILKELERLCKDNAAREEQMTAFNETMQSLRAPGGDTGKAAAESVFELLDRG